jgi:hypothetical protein
VGTAYTDSSNKKGSTDGRVIFGSNSPGICSVALDQCTGIVTVTLKSRGTCTIEAQATATGKYASATTDVSYIIAAPTEPVFTVTSLTDDNPHGNGTGNAARCSNQSLPGATLDSNCSLRDAIAAAEASYTADTTKTQTVNFSSSLQVSGSTIGISNPGTYTLTGGTLTIGQAGVKMNIVGPGVGVLSISGANTYRVFSVTNIGEINLSGLTITDGSGGGIYLGNDSGLSMDHCIVYGNSSTSGGGIYLSGGSMITINNSAIVNNTATDGGGIYIGQGAAATLYYSTVSGNSLSSGGFGAGINNDSPQGSDLILYNSTVSGNYINGTSSGGAGIYSNYYIDDNRLTNSIVSGRETG